MVISALELADSVRYSITILRPGTRELRDVRMAVTLPMDADSVEAFETPGYTRFLGNDGGPLRWEADRYVAYENVDPFTFLLRQPPSGDFAVSARWSGGGSTFRACPADQGG